MCMKCMKGKKKNGCKVPLPADDNVNSAGFPSVSLLETSQEGVGWGWPSSSGLTGFPEIPDVNRIQGIGDEFDFEFGSSSGHHSPKIPGVNQIEGIGEDVLNLIFENLIFDFEHFQPGSPTATQIRKDLLSAAMTCKAFVEPALNSLWRVLPSLLPLLLLFPSAEVVNGQYFVNNLLSTEWERFEIHARRVRTLYMEPTRVVISPTIYLLIRDMYGSFLRILPGLKAIYIPDENTIDLPSVILLALGASLDVVELNNSAISDRNFYIPFLSLLASKSPQLSHLVLRGLGDISLEPLYRLKNIQRLEIRLPGTYLYPETLQNLGNLVDLQDLTLDAGTSTPARPVSMFWHTFSPSSCEIFGRLKKLRIIGIPRSIDRVLDDINLANLSTLIIDEVSDNTGAHTESYWKHCFQQLSACLMIEDIEINQHDYRCWGHEHYSLSTSWFRPFTNLSNVKNLVINGAALSGSDEEFHLMAVGFRNLKKLVVPPEYHSEGRTLACLFYFSRYCPDLREIKICIGYDIVKNLDAMKNLPFPDWHSNLLEKLYINSQFGKIEIGDMVQVAQFLDPLFPNLSILETYDSSATEASTWAGIQKIRVALQATRIKTLHRVKSEMVTASTESSND